jgi:hypothetical protein
MSAAPFPWAIEKTNADAAIARAGAALAAPFVNAARELAIIGPVYDSLFTPAVATAKESWTSAYNATLSRWSAARATALEGAERVARRAERLALDARAGLPQPALVRGSPATILAPDVGTSTNSPDAPPRTATRTLTAAAAPVLRLSAKAPGAASNRLEVRIAHGVGTAFTLSLRFGAAYVEAFEFAAPGSAPSSELVNFEWLTNTRPDVLEWALFSGGAGAVVESVRARIARAIALDGAASLRTLLATALASVDSLRGPPSLPDAGNPEQWRAFAGQNVAYITTDSTGAVQSAVASSGGVRGSFLTMQGLEYRMQGAVATLAPLVSAMTGPL